MSSFQKISDTILCSCSSSSLLVPDSLFLLFFSVLVINLLDRSLLPCSAHRPELEYHDHRLQMAQTLQMMYEVKAREMKNSNLGNCEQCEEQSSVSGSSQ